MTDLIRLDKCLSENYGFTRKEAGRFVRNGSVEVNGDVVKDAGFKVSSDDSVVVDGAELSVRTKHDKRYIMLNKPIKTVCAADDPENPSVLGLIPDEERNGLFCVGRLDADTEGLLLITDDGQWGHRITSPKHHCTKVYEAVLADDCPKGVIKDFAAGIFLRGEKEKTKPAILEIIEPRKVQLSICEGRYHQVKRMFAAAGNKVISLKRISIGSLKLDPDLLSGEHRYLTSEEVSGIFAEDKTDK